jgi:hypothetical protein
MPHPFLSEAEIDDLRVLAAMIIPASTKYDIPGADDAAIFADMLTGLDHDRAEVAAALAVVRGRAGGPLAGLGAAARSALAARLQQEPEVAILARHVMLAYYRDDRVMRSLGLEPRAPYPKGHEVEPGDWSLLDPVRARPPLWRPAPR